MSTAALPNPHTAPDFYGARSRPLPATGFSRPIVPMRRIVRRRGTKQQGRALEALGHAVEYMMDSRLLLAASNPRADAEAVRLLTQASRAVFAECPEILPRRERLIRWVRTSVLSRA